METNHLLLNVPEQIKTDRLLLRAPRFGDGAFIADTVRASLPELKRWMPWATDDYGATDAELWSRRVIARLMMRTEFPFLIFTQDQTHIGTIGLVNVDWQLPKVEVGYWLATAQHGHGYMTEAVNAINGFARTHLKARRLEIRTDAQNAPSRRVAERCGYQLEGILRAYERGPSGELRDQCIYARIE